MPRKKRIYLDACCLNRPFDDQSQERIRLETEAVILILSRVQRGYWEQIGSEVLDFEIDQTPDLERRARVKVLARAVHRPVPVEKQNVERDMIWQPWDFTPSMHCI